VQNQWLILLVISSIALFLIVGKTLKGSWNPFKWVWMGVINVLIGALGLYFINLFGHFVNFNIPINLITASVVGVLGLPGLVSVVLVKLWVGI
jgi:inhibitor of the pro-sigma K processing machinery